MSPLRRPGFLVRHVLRSRKGFTLVELIVVMGIFMFIIIISSEAFNKLLTLSTQQTKSAESDTQGILGLEMLRIDLQHAGYGLPWELTFQDNFEEAQAASGSLAPGVDPKDYNDNHNTSTDTNKVPRAVQAGTSPSGSDYLVLKSTLINTSDTSKKWAYVEGVGSTSTLKAWGNNNFASGEKVVTLNSKNKQLITRPVVPPAVMTADDFSYGITSATMTPPDGFQPPSESTVYLVYGVSSAGSLRVPYNRVDYYVKRPASTSEMPARCAPGTGILYKAVMNHPAGDFTELPLLECVADMQVVFQLDTNGDGGADSFATHTGLSSLSARDIRQQLKTVNVYVVAHEGGKDANFSYNKGKDLAVGEGYGRTLDLQALVGGADYKNYRWKTYKISVNPKNINY
ncbi:PilW family protein [Geomonas azotofigens]|uniref:PilW family protein n=1 Tax=Geomonas azotofigens TaxID=2843196 RepID=UPI001C10D621|nr:PilW family protein [Geomonas azotofigens]MBU5613304.1 PilW family protein [Geomonas azotofigens]